MRNMLIFKVAIFLFLIDISHQSITLEQRAIRSANVGSYVDCTRCEQFCPLGASKGAKSGELQQVEPIKSCRDDHLPGQYILQLSPHSTPFVVSCVVGGWVVIQQRRDGSENFYRSWTDYRDGFGKLNREFWLGLEQIHQITNSGTYQLLVEIGDFHGINGSALYSSFAIAGMKEGYKLLKLGTYSGSAGDSLRTHVGMKFSTYDSDSDRSKGENCASRYHGAWWYDDCSVQYESNLNGKYTNNGMHDSMMWLKYSATRSLRFSRMMLRKV